MLHSKPLSSPLAERLMPLAKATAVCAADCMTAIKLTVTLISWGLGFRVYIILSLI